MRPSIALSLLAASLSLAADVTIRLRGDVGGPNGERVDIKAVKADGTVLAEMPNYLVFTEFNTYRMTLGEMPSRIVVDFKNDDATKNLYLDVNDLRINNAPVSDVASKIQFAGSAASGEVRQGRFLAGGQYVVSLDGSGGGNNNNNGEPWTCVGYNSPFRKNGNDVECWSQDGIRCFTGNCQEIAQRVAPNAVKCTAAGYANPNHHCHKVFTRIFGYSPSDNNPNPSPTPAPNPSTAPRWWCFRHQNSFMRLSWTTSGDRHIQCATSDPTGYSCLTFANADDCRRPGVAMPGVLVCGPDHNAKYNDWGYDKPNHWCYRGWTTLPR